jgi:hypothetical protein
MGQADGAVVGLTQIVNNGSASKRMNIVIVAEGYKRSQLGQFEGDAQQFVNYLFATPPFDQLQAAFNIYRLNVRSVDEGADDPTACQGTGAKPQTYFDASFCGYNLRRLLLVDDVLVQAEVEAFVPQWHLILVLVNSTLYGGSGGKIATTSLAQTQKGWENIAIHEMGHSLFGLADEYEYYEGCGAETTQDKYSGAEPRARNVTKKWGRTSIKWKQMVLPATPMPTTGNADCTRCDPQQNRVAAGTVGAFEGGYYYHCGIFRPAFDCMMRNFAPFCAVCSQRIRDKMDRYMK